MKKQQKSKEQQQHINYRFICKICGKEVGTSTGTTEFNNSGAIVICGECQKLFFVNRPVSLWNLADYMYRKKLEI